MALHVNRKQIANLWNNKTSPVLSVKSGDTVTFDCLDASGGMILPDSTVKAMDTFDASKADPIFGPVYIEDAQPGDALEIEVLHLEHSDWGWTGMLPGFGLLADDFRSDGPQLKIWKLSAGSDFVQFKDNIRIPIRPFMGTMGVAPREDGDHSTIPPLDSGGNIDCRHVTKGTKLILPVQVPGALFSCGDGHCAQGDGEVCGTAVEVAMKVTCRFKLLKDHKHVTSPHFRCPAPKKSLLPDDETHNTMGIDADVLVATQKAVRAMITWLGVEKGLSRVDAYMLCSLAVNLQMSEVVDINYGITASLPLNIFTDHKPSTGLE